MDTIVNPFKQASLGLVKGVTSFPSNVVKGVTKIGDGLTSVSDSVVENAGKIFRTNSNNNDNNNRINVQLTRDLQAFPMVEEPQAEVGDDKREREMIRDEIVEFRVRKIFHYVCYW